VAEMYELYDRIHRRNEAEAQRRREEVYGKLPELQHLHERIKAMQVERILKTAGGEPFDTSVLANLQSQAERLFADAGYAADYLDPVFTCPACRDTGILPDSRRCGCYRRYRLENQLSEARLSGDTASFELFDLSRFSDKPMENGKSQRDYMTQYKRITMAWADSFPNCKPMLLISGGTGLGKTYTARCIQRRVIEHGFPTAAYTAYRLFSLFHSDRLGEDVDMDAILTVPLLVIDDLGTEPMTRNVTIEYFFDLLNERAAAELHTVIVTNLDFMSLNERYGERIHSRLMDARHSEKLIFRGRDIRY